MPRMQLRLTPRGHLLLEEADDAPILDDKVALRLTEAFGRSPGYGLLQLGAGAIGQSLPPAFIWWRDFAVRYLEAVCLHGSGGAGEGRSAAFLSAIALPAEAELATLVLTAPMMPGAEYLTADVLRRLWVDLGTAFTASFIAAGTDLQAFLKMLNPAWNLIGRVHFNLAENRRDPEWPFAFLATYTTRLSAQARAQHVPLGQALREYAGAANRDKLLSLLVPVQRAAEHFGWLKAMVDTGEIFHPVRWSSAEAARLLNSVPDLESAGVIVRLPAHWREGRPSRPQVTATVGARPPSGTGLDALLDFHMDVTLEGEPLTAKEMATLLAGTETLVLLRGQWVEIDRPRLDRAMRRFKEVQDLAEQEGLTFAEAMRLLAGTEATGDDEPAVAAEWSQITAGAWLTETLTALRNPDGAGVDPGPALKGRLRPYQQAGVEWLHLLSGLGLGACLADDMGLGKTIQVLSLLLIQKRKGAACKPSLLVAPASLLANWAAEIERFAPGLNARIVHPSAMSAEDLNQMAAEGLANLDLVITSYGSLLRLPVLGATSWRFVVLDEAQAIKNPNAKQTRAAKALQAESRIALTGTPVENHLGDLWSIFDFINPGLLGSAKEFGRTTKAMAERPHNPYGPLRDLVRPYILRRMKTDKTVITDLPDKTEVKALCLLSRKQAALYARTVADLTEALQDAEGIRRKGIVLATLMRLKQICNHPSQWLNDGKWAEADSGKWARLREIAEVVAARQEKMLVFTQFREMTAPLAAYLGRIFGRPGLILHGDTAVKHRRALVRTFQEDETVPFFVLSLKAGGSGLTLTAASHVVHFDRWWNPAVENQATDRAFRIGQTNNVLVHKFVCQGTVEEKIDALIEAKKGLSDDLLAGGDEINLTEMKDEDLLRMVTLDLKSVMAE
ncbi:ATP-dependent helicase [Microvirga sp. SYSU G3D207]|uniref:ATP-dependent helicase n=2 Tax=Microvirga arsenatis TaxID=2692265 RepID=A0ABW9Z874_9HYPH|nr:DEAD/DEAH box helicase [Microvirga arsenatis]NBJ13042.1 ATP-dependent helicase [Microvirga arsenatis]NBJ26839.1 ATP-dependent helicase [Microvirga arsenatis]